MKSKIDTTTLALPIPVARRLGTRRSAYFFNICGVNCGPVSRVTRGGFLRWFWVGTVRRRCSVDFCWHDGQAYLLALASIVAVL